MADLKKKVDDLKGEWAISKAQEDRKVALITGLFEAIGCLENELTDIKYELADKKDAIRVARNRIEDFEQQARDGEREKERYAFVSVIVDGDSVPFRDELVKQGIEGGKRAAGLLKKAVEEELRASKASAPHVEITARVYANIKGLEKVYKDTNVLPRSECFGDFIRGFNMGDPMCDFVDAGNGKECSDEKVKAVFISSVTDSRCQRIYFGGSADNGYARLLGRYLETKGVRERVCLLEGPPFAPELAEIKDRFGTATFTDVFRTQKLPTLKRKVSIHSTTPPTTPSTAYATVASRSASTTPPTTHTGPSAPPPVYSETTGGKAQFNRLGQRIDSELKFSSIDFQDLKARKLCNWFHLAGRCPYAQGYGSCYHEHGERIPERQRAALLAISRLSPCAGGAWCDDPKCISGHQCPRRNCHVEDCRFPRDMHDMDTQVVR